MNICVLPLGVWGAQIGVSPNIISPKQRGNFDPPPLKWSGLRYVFDIKEDCNGKEAFAGAHDCDTPVAELDGSGLLLWGSHTRRPSDSGNKWRVEASQKGKLGTGPVPVKVLIALVIAWCLLVTKLALRAMQSWAKMRQPSGEMNALPPRPGI
jgi:hypothetical protein